MHSPSSASYMFPIAKAIPFWMSGVICSLAWRKQLKICPQPVML
jgi:hypothetical protein